MVVGPHRSFENRANKGEGKAGSCRFIQKGEPRSKKSRPRMDGAADVRVVTARGWKVPRQLSDANPKNKNDHKRNQIGKRCGHACVGCRELNREQYRRRGGSMRYALHEHTGKSQSA